MTDPHRALHIGSLHQLDRRDRIVTIGTFDGVHRGHQALLSAAITRAKELDAATLVVTFEPVPAMVLRPDRFAGRVCSVSDKLRLLAAQPLDDLLMLVFDHHLAEQTPEQFMAAIAAYSGMKELWVGEAFALGKNRTGNVERLREIGADLGFAVNAVPRLTDHGHVISSSAIRNAIVEGDVARADRYLGRPFRIAGEVIHGAHLGRAIGYPTANVVPPEELVALADGIYVSWTTLPGDPTPRPSMTYVGTRPTVNAGARLIESHLLDFNGDLYGQIITVDVLERLRGDAVFSGVDALIAQLRVDESATRAYLDLATRRH